MSFHINAGTEKDPKNSRFQRFMSQFIATTAGFMLLFDLGSSQFFPGIIIPALTGKSNHYNSGQTLSLTPDQASWLGSVSLVSATIGCVLSAVITDYLGRKRSMMLVNVPLLIAWFMMYNSKSLLEIFIANTLLGLGCGLMESPVIAYVGEICETEFRSFLMAYTYVGSTFGALFVSILNTLMPWRMVAFACIFVPILTLIILLFVPESPLWLLSKNRSLQADDSLCWLRGWAPKEATFDEFQALQRYNDRSKSCGSCIKRNLMCSHPLTSVVEKYREFKRKQTLKPLFIIVTLVCMLQISRVITIKPFILQIFKAYESPIPPDQAAAVLNFMNIIAHVIFLFVTHFIGKRRLYLTMLMAVFLSTAVLCAYGFAVLPIGYNSFSSSKGLSLENKNLAYIPFVCIIFGSFCTFCGVSAVPSQMMSELFKFKVRGTATGLIATFSYVLNFVITKTYYDMETSWSLPGVTLLTCGIIGLGLISLYSILPETTNRSLEDIEHHFSDNSKKITNRKILRKELKQGVAIDKCPDSVEKSGESPVNGSTQIRG